MPDHEDTTNPRILLSDLVTSKQCEERSGNITKAVEQQTRTLESQNKTLTSIHKDVTSIRIEQAEHKAFHRGGEYARAGSKSAGQYWARIAGLILAITLAFGAAVWTVSRLTGPSAQDIAKAIRENPHD